MVATGRTSGSQIEGRPTRPAFTSHFTNESRSAVDAFHREAMAAYGTDNGAPGLRPEYHPTYYAAFVVDPHGRNVEVVHDGWPS